MCLALHPHNIGRPNAAKHLDEALRYILGHEGVWNTTADDIAEYYMANCYSEVSAWIAESARPTNSLPPIVLATQFRPVVARDRSRCPTSRRSGGDSWETTGSVSPRKSVSWFSTS
jgi:hypothetical protein